MSPPNVVAERGENVKLICKVLLSTSQGCSWLFQKRGDGLAPTFLIYLSSTRKKSNDNLNSNQISGEKNGDEYTLTLSKFSEENQGFYFCSVTSNSVVYFSPLVPVFLPGLGAEVSSPGCWGVTSEHVSHADVLLLNLLGTPGGGLLSHRPYFTDQKTEAEVPGGIGGDS